MEMLLPLGDLPPPPPYSLFSGDQPLLAIGIAVILLGFGITALLIWATAFLLRTLRREPAVTKQV